MTAYYNENDPKAAAWLRELIKQDLIAAGDVDERSIVDVKPTELKDYTQCHFFAGIGGWSYALRVAGWPDERPVWTGSCPCQSFSAAGKGRGFADERHLWPIWFHLIEHCQPTKIFGEQVASKAALDWLDLVQTDLEGTGYAVGAADLCAAGIGAPHIRQRLYFGAQSLADTERTKLNGSRKSEKRRCAEPSNYDDAIGLAQPDSGERERRAKTAGRNNGNWEDPGRAQSDSGAARCGADGGFRRPGPTNEFWRDADWLRCTDDKWRPVEPGSFPLAHGVPGRVGLLRGYGNAIVPQVAATFIEAFGAALCEVAAA